MLSNGTFKGYVRGSKDIEGKNTKGFQVTLSVNTPEKKTEEGYPPSFLLQATFWGQTAEAASTFFEKNNPKVATVTGDLLVSYNYVKDDGEPNSIMRLNGNRIVFDYTPQPEAEQPEAEQPAKKTSKTSTSKKKETTVDPEEFEFE